MSSFTPRAWKTALPIARTAFIGRDRDIADVKGLLDHLHLITLSGSGGVGKTRLALEIGAELFNRYPNGVWSVDLAPTALLAVRRQHRRRFDNREMSVRRNRQLWRI